MEKEENIKKGKKYLVIGVLVLFLAILGSSVAYYLARVQGSLSGNAAGSGLDLTITPLSTSATGDLIPLDNDKDTLTMAALGYGNETTNFDATKSCIDINGYSVCQVYKITLTNKGSVPLVVNSTVDLYGDNTPNIDCTRMDSSTSVTNNASCKGNNTLANNERINGNSSKEYYVIVYINNLDEPQEDKGEFDGTITFTSTQGIAVKGRFKPGVTLVEHITNLYTSTPKTVVTANAEQECLETDNLGNCTNSNITKTIDYNYAKDVNLMNDRLGGTTEDLDGGNIRYYGKNPNNYIDIGDKIEVSTYRGNWNGVLVPPDYWYTSEECFTGVESFGWTDDYISSNTPFNSINDYCSESIVDTAGTPILWRIIGVFDGKIRIRRDEPINGYSYGYSYDTSAINVNNGWGVNEWSQADLMKLLNPGYESESVGGSLWWNSETGKCYNGPSYANTNCDFTNLGLSEKAKEYVIDQTLYLGGFDTTSVFANEAWTIERGNDVFNSTKECAINGSRACTDLIPRTTSWTGKVGLVYPSDFGYAADFSDDSCKGNLMTFGRCSENWMANRDTFTISPWSESGMMEMNVGTIFNQVNSFGNYDSLPTLTLDSSVLIDGGSGSKENPYVLTS